MSNTDHTEAAAMTQTIANDEAARLLGVVENLRAVLKMHHDWHLQIGVVLFPAEEGQTEPTELDLSVEYSDGTLCNRTMEALYG